MRSLFTMLLLTSLGSLTANILLVDVTVEVQGVTISCYYHGEIWTTQL